MTTNVAVVLAVAIVYGMATVAAQTLVDVPASRFDSPVQFNSDFAVAVGLAWTLYQYILHQGDRLKLRDWSLACRAMVLLCIVQANDVLVDAGWLFDDWLLDVGLWCVASSMLYGVLRRAPKQPWALRLWWMGVAFQIVFIVFDFRDGRFMSEWLPVPFTASLTEWAELLAIECSVVALVVAGLQPPEPSFKAAGIEELGALARRLFETGPVRRLAKYPPVPLAFYPGVRALLLIIVALTAVIVCGRSARRASRRSLRAQLGDLVVLCLRDGFDPLSYYQQDLHRSGGRAEAAQYLTRHETKNGLLGALNGMKEQPYARSEMADKLVFDACCRRAGLPTAKILMHFDGSRCELEASPEEMDCDLFAKPRRGRGARGTLSFRRVGENRYRGPAGEEIGLAVVIDRLGRHGRETPMIVQPHLRNHADVADLAEQSLVTVRVITCLDQTDQPVPTHGVLRLLGKLEHQWKVDDEWGAPIDMATGRLGLLASDRLSRCTLRLERHPFNGRLVAGRVLTTWPAIRALAVASHLAFAHRVIVGWDIASTDAGVVLLEGNVNLDIMFAQRVYGEGAGRGPLGPLLRHHLDVLNRTSG